MTLRNITCYDYRRFDSMLLILTEDGKQLNIYCPSDCIYNDGSSRFYCYENEVSRRVGKSIDILEYDPDKTYGLQCDGTAEFIWYGDVGTNRYDDLERQCILSCNPTEPPINIWDRFNDVELVDRARNTAAWGGLAEAFSAVAKNISDTRYEERPEEE